MSIGETFHESTKAGIIVTAVAALLIGMLALDPPDRWPAPYPRQELGRHGLAYAGPEAVTVLSLGIDAAAEARAAAAVDGATYHAAYAEGPAGRSGLWTGAHSVDLARRYALAACGEGCAVLAERRPLHATETPGDATLILLPEMARRIGLRWPFPGGGNALAIGGAGAWGTGHAGSRAGETRRAIFRAVAECEARRVAEETPEGIESPPCRYMSLMNADILDIRPETPLYPAPYTIATARLMAVHQEELRLMRGDGTPMPGLNRFRRPDKLHGARASNGESRSRAIDGAGWPEAADGMALALCEAARRFGDPPCTIATRRMPDRAMPEGTLAVTPELMEAFRAWQETEGAGAFAIGALGDWGTSHGFGTLEDARQRAADWCAYYARRGGDAYTLRRSFIEQPPCRIVAERAG